MTAFRPVCYRRHCFFALCVFALVVGCDRTVRTGETDAAIPSETALPSEAGSAAAVRPAMPVAPLGDARTGSLIVVAKLGSTAFALVADADDRALHLVDLEQGADVETIPLESPPGQMVISRDGRLFVALPQRAEIAIFAAKMIPGSRLEQVASLTVAPNPVALALTDGADEQLVVASGSSATVASFRVDTRQPKFSLTVGREPRALIADGSGQSVIVGHGVTGDLELIDVPSGTLRPRVELNRKKHSFCWTTPGPEYNSCNPYAERFARQVFAFARDDDEDPAKRHIVVPDVMVDPTSPGIRLPPTLLQTTAKTSFSPALFDVDEVNNGTKTDPGWHEFLQMEGVSTVGKLSQCALPRAAVATTGQAHAVYVACLGDDVVEEYATGAAHPVGASWKRKWRVASGPLGLAARSDQNELLVFSQFERVVSRISLGTRATKDAGTDADAVILLSRPRAPRASAIDEGRRLFFATQDRRISRDGRACESCHLDGGDDGLTWTMPQGPRATRPLRRHPGGEPYGAKGEYATFADAARADVQNLKGTGLGDSEIQQIEAYLLSLDPAFEAPPTTNH